MSPDDERDFASRLESRLMRDGVYLESVTETDGGYELTYESVAADQADDVPHQEVGSVINVVRELHGDGWTGADIDATVTDLDGEVVGRWHVDRDWLAALEAGDLSEVAFSQKVVDTIETVRR